MLGLGWKLMMRKSEASLPFLYCTVATDGRIKLDLRSYTVLRIASELAKESK